MKFIKEVTVDWYDNIIKAFCTDINDVIYYCSLLALNIATNEKIYLCVDIKYLKGHEELLNIINANSVKENWNKLPELINLKKANETYILKAKDIRSDDIALIRYELNYNWPEKLIWGDYPTILAQAAKMDDWWSYFKKSNKL